MKKCLILLLAALLFLGAAGAGADVPEAFTPSTLRREVYTPDGAGPFQYYAQNDPVWADAFYESYKIYTRRRFGDGGCNPTSLAIVIASMVNPQQLPTIRDYAYQERPFYVCEHSVNNFHCRTQDPDHVQAVLETPEDFLACLPLVMGNYATGNNPIRHRYRVEGGNGGTSSAMFPPVAEHYGLDITVTRNLDLALAGLERGAMVIALCNGVKQPFSGTNGHYVVMASKDENYVYFLDPYIRDEYVKDKYKVIEPVEPGVKQVKLENLFRLQMGYFAIFEHPAQAVGDF